MSTEKINAGLQIIEGVQFFPEIQALLVTNDSSDEFKRDHDLQPVSIGSYKIAPWGPDNHLPEHLLKKVEKSDVVGANLRFNRDVSFGLGPKLVRAVKRDEYGRVLDWAPVEDGPIFDWFEANDIPLFVQQQLTDVAYFYNAFPEILLSKDFQSIQSIRHKEAVFSRWSQADRKGDINWHYYADWSKNQVTAKDITATRVLDEFDTMTDLKIFAAEGKTRRYIYPVYMPSPGHPYYSEPEWYSIFRSGWYDHSVLVPELKKAILKNQLGVKFIIYVAQEYFDNICKMEGISKTDLKAYQERIDQEKQAFNDFLAGEKNANKAIMAMKQRVPTAQGTQETKWIEIVPIENKITGGEYIDDTESTANIICYAMGVHSSLIGATPGKSSSTLGGTQARELYMMKQACMKPIVDRVLRPLRFIKQFNKWEKDIYINIPEYIFTTLDQNKSGKQESTNTEV